MPVIVDIEALKNAEQALRESEIRMRALLDASQDEILLVSTDGAVLVINKAARARLAKRIAPIGLRLDQFLPKDLAESRLTVVQQVAATATLAHLEQQIGAQWFEFCFYPVVRPDGGVSEVAVYAREITERKQAEGNLRNLYQAIQQSPVSVMITDIKGRIEYVNPKFTEITGYTLAEAIGQNPRILTSGHTPREEYGHLWETITSGGVWRGEFHNRKKNRPPGGELSQLSTYPAARRSGRRTARPAPQGVANGLGQPRLGRHPAELLSSHAFSASTLGRRNASFARRPVTRSSLDTESRRWRRSSSAGAVRCSGR